MLMKIFLTLNYYQNTVTANPNALVERNTLQDYIRTTIYRCEIYPKHHPRGDFSRPRRKELLQGRPKLCSNNCHKLNFQSLYSTNFIRPNKRGQNYRKVCPATASFPPKLELQLHMFRLQHLTLSALNS